MDTRERKQTSLSAKVCPIIWFMHTAVTAGSKISRYREEQKMSGARQKKENPGKVGFVKFWAWNLRAVSTGANLMVLGYLTMYCTDFLGLNAGVLAILLVGSKVIDAFTDLIAGVLVDRTNTKIGRGRPYELAIIGLWLCTWLMFSVPAGWAPLVKYIWVFVMYVMVNSVFTTLLNANATAYTVRAFSNHEQYVKITTLGFIVPMVGVAIFNIMFPTLLGRIATTHAGWSRLVGMVSILMLAIGILRFIFVPETNKALETPDKKNEKVSLKDILEVLKKDKYIIFILLTTLVVNFSTNLGVGSYYFKYIVGDIGLQSIVSLFQMCSIPLAFIIPMLLKRTTCVKVITVGAIIYAVGSIIYSFAGASIPLIIAAALLTGVGSVPASMLMGLLIIDLCDYHEYIGLPRMEGTVSAVNGFATKVGSAVSTGLSGLLLTASGFISTTEGFVEQPSSAINMIRAMMSFIPAALWIVVAICMSAFTLEKQMPKIRETLQARHAAAGGESSGK